jgi:hypothetical protein
VAEQEHPEFEKEVVAMPDGRRLIYYWFVSTSPRPRPAPEEQEPPPPRTRSA